jgi:hypothetical protein
MIKLILILHIIVTSCISKLDKPGVFDLECFFSFFIF